MKGFFDRIPRLEKSPQPCYKSPMNIRQHAVPDAVLFALTNTAGKYFFSIVLLIFCGLFASCGKSNDDTMEYYLLWEDLANINIAGYQTHFDTNDYTGKKYLNGHVQGALMFTDVSHNFAIQGPGFFRVIIDDEIIGYTRNGNFSFTIDDSGNNVLYPQRARLRNHEYKLADNIDIYMAITEENADDESVIVDSIRADNEEQFFNTNTPRGGIYRVELDWVKTAGQLKIYDVPYEKLQHFSDGIYVLEPDYTDEIKIHQLSGIIPKCIETSNVPLIEVISRMYLIALNNEKIKNVVFKRELLKLALSHHGNENRCDFISSIIPFLHLDY